MTYFDYPVNLTDINKTLQYTNTVSEGYLGLSILLIVFIVSLTTLLLRFPPKESMISALFTSTIVSILLWLLDILPAEAPPIMTLLMAFGIVLMYADRSGSG